MRMATSHTQAHAGRRAVRIAAEGTLEVQHPAIESALPVRDISLDGFALESPVAFVPATEHRFTFTAYDGSPTCVDAVVAHCMAMSGLGSERYLTGFAFVTESNAQRANVIKVLNTIAIALSE
jgi:hypothetical protein